MFEGTPLADYLNDQNNNNNNRDDNNKRQSGRLRTETVKMRQMPIMLTAGQSDQIQRRRIKRLVANALKSRLSEAENTQFLERFRYVLVSSDLLDSRIYNRVSSSTMKRHEHEWEQHEMQQKDKQRRSILFGIEGPWSILKMEHKYWVGGGACIIVIVTLLTWGIRQKKKARMKTIDRSQFQFWSGEHDIVVVLIIFLSMALFLFAHSRRRLLRMLRAKAISYLSHFISNNEKFDVAVGKCLGLIMEMELLAQGFRPDLSSGTSVSVSNSIDRNLSGKHIRSSIAAALYLSISSYLDAINGCLPFVNELDLMRYLDIYDLNVREMNEYFGERKNNNIEQEQAHFGIANFFAKSISRERYYGSQGANSSLTKLKHEFSKLHYLRRIYMCCLLSINSSGVVEKKELDAWSTIVTHIKSCSELMIQLSNAVNRERLCLIEMLDDDNSFDGVRRLSAELQPHNHVVNELAAGLQHVDARLQMMREAIDNEIVDNDYYANYEIIGNDIQSLMESWERGLKTLCADNNNNNNNVNNKDNNNNNINNSTSISTPQITSSPIAHSVNSTLHDFDDILSSNTTLADGSSEDWRMFSPRLDLAIQQQQRLTHRRTDTNTTLISSSSDATILQGIVEDDIKPARSSLSRQERIKIMQQQREADIQHKVSQQHRQNFVVELGSVLHRRSEQWE